MLLGLLDTSRFMIVGFECINFDLFMSPAIPFRKYVLRCIISNQLFVFSQSLQAEYLWMLLFLKYCSRKHCFAFNNIFSF